MRSYQPAARMAEIAPFHVMELLGRARVLEAQGRDIIHMEVGEPDFPTPAPIVAAAQAAIASGEMFYTSATGLLQLRQAIRQHYQDYYGVDVPARRIFITAGASGALTLALACLTERDGQWLLPDPGYPCNRHFVRVFEGKPVSLPVSPAHHFQPTVDDLANHWTAQTQGLMLASPANPTGTLLSQAEIAALFAAIQQRNGHLIVDEIYHGLTYAGKADTALSVSDEIWIVQSFSKFFQMTGWRLGWLVVPEAYLADVEKLAQNLFIAPSTPAQHAALAAFLPETQAILEQRRQAFQARRDFLIPRLQALGFQMTTRPEGAFYLYCDCSALLGHRFADSFALARQMLEDIGVAATPGLDFGQQQPERYIRFAYTTAIERLEVAVQRMQAYFAS